jgi:hypothetical protein
LKLKKHETEQKKIMQNQSQKGNSWVKHQMGAKKEGQLTWLSWLHYVSKLKWKLYTLAIDCVCASVHQIKKAYTVKAFPNCKSHDLHPKMYWIK